MTDMLAGRVALVTGGCGGAGRAVCERFEAEGATVYAADLSATGSFDGASRAGEFVEMDVTSEAAIQQTMAMIGDRHGVLDVLVNAAGIELELSIEETSLEAWNRIMAINVTGTFLTMIGTGHAVDIDHRLIMRHGNPIVELQSGYPYVVGA